MKATETVNTNSPSTLVAIAWAAWTAGDRDLERAARRQLADRFGMTIGFPRKKLRIVGEREMAHA